MYYTLWEPLFSCKFRVDSYKEKNYKSFLLSEVCVRVNVFIAKILLNFIYEDIWYLKDIQGGYFQPGSDFRIY